VLGGNFYGVTPVRGRYDASYGLMLHGLGDGSFQPVDMEASNLVIEGQVRHMKLLRHANGDRLIVVARNDNTLQIIRVPRSNTRPGLSLGNGRSGRPTDRGSFGLPRITGSIP
jgi:hypothetical protein